MSAGSLEDYPLISPQVRRRLLTTLLKNVSRAFYLSVRVLPSEMREPVGIAYLLARAADTIADTPTLTAEHRRTQLLAFRQVVAGEVSAGAEQLSAELADLQPTDGESELLDSLPELLALLNALDGADAELTRSVVDTLTSGMHFDLATFSQWDSENPTALQTPEQMEEYCYLVAGCVGEFWTSMSVLHADSVAHWDEQEMRSLGVRFGLALQMTNILRDLPKDLQMGRCYLPQTILDRAGLLPRDLLDATSIDSARPVLSWGIRLTLDHYSAAERYILAIPRRNLRLRLAAFWPAIIGLETLLRLSRSAEWLNADIRIKIPRSSVYGIIALSLLCGRSNTLIRHWFGRIRRRIERELYDSNEDNKETGH